MESTQRLQSIKRTGRDQSSDPPGSLDDGLLIAGPFHQSERGGGSSGPRTLAEGSIP